MEELYQLVSERNARETTPFIAIHEANATLLNQIDALQSKCEDQERELLDNQGGSAAVSSLHDGRSGTMAQSAALKNEMRLREKLEKLQEELTHKMMMHAQDQTSALEMAKQLASAKDNIRAHEGTIKKMEEEITKKDRRIEHMTNELEDARSRTKLAEQQYVGLKNSIRVLQEENDGIKKENRILESRLLTDKEKMVGEINHLSEMCEKLKRQNEMLRSLKSDEEKRKSSWFGLSSTTNTKTKSPTKENGSSEDRDSRKFNPKMAVVVPTKPRQKITAHTAEASCLRYVRGGKLANKKWSHLWILLVLK